MYTPIINIHNSKVISPKPHFFTKCQFCNVTADASIYFLHATQNHKAHQTAAESSGGSSGWHAVAAATGKKTSCHPICRLVKMFLYILYNVESQGRLEKNFYLFSNLLI